MTPGETQVVALKLICTPGYSKSARYVPDKEKRQVFADYGIPQSGKCEVDHLDSLELGGTNNLKNLWPQRYRGRLNAHMKDALENRLHWLVCHGRLDLAEAQREISTDWVKAYDKYITHGPKKGTK
jgi:hypothetical protein